jgi:CheY-like chemotaxis protein
VPDLILLDLNLPKISGIELLGFLRGLDALSSVPMVVWSSARSEQERKALEQFNVTCFVTKSIHYADFLTLGSTLREILEQHRSARA